MTTDTLTNLGGTAGLIGVLVYMLKYFIAQLDKKDNQTIKILEEKDAQINKICEQNNAVIADHTKAIQDLTVTLREYHKGLK